MSEERPQERHESVKQQQPILQQLKNAFAFLNTHGPAIQTVIAIIMLVSLLMGWHAIKLSQKQFESTIEPQLEIEYGSPDFAMIQQAMQTNAVGVHVAIETNITVGKPQLEAFVRSCTNFCRVNFKNLGAVSISGIDLLMAIEIATDESNNLREVMTDYVPQVLANHLRPGENAWHYFGDHPAIKRLNSLRPPESRRRVVCFVLRYNRSVDMKPNIRYVFFMTGTVAQDATLFAVPLSQKTQALGSMNATAIEVRSKYEEAVRKIVEQADVLGVRRE
jgi:hypothetical protein